MNYEYILQLLFTFSIFIQHAMTTNINALFLSLYSLIKPIQLCKGNLLKVYHITIRVNKTHLASQSRQKDGNRGTNSERFEN